MRIGVVQIRFWQMSDLPALSQMSIVTAWEIMNPSDREVASPATVATNAHRNLIQTLSSPGGTALVADEEGQPVGFLLIGLRPEEKTGRPEGYMADVYVLPSHRGQGLAAQLHEAGEIYLRRLGIRRASNWVHATNPLGKKASDARGFKLWGVMMEKLLQPTSSSASG